MEQAPSRGHEFEGWFGVANVQRPAIDGLPNDVDGAVKTSAIATNERLNMRYFSSME